LEPVRHNGLQPREVYFLGSCVSSQYGLCARVRGCFHKRQSIGYVVRPFLGRLEGPRRWLPGTSEQERAEGNEGHHLGAARAMPEDELSGDAGGFWVRRSQSDSRWRAIQTETVGNFWRMWPNQNGKSNVNYKGTSFRFVCQTSLQPWRLRPNGLYRRAVSCRSVAQVS